ncbi:hypothetical protein IE81DRAFT_122263 [Ceraceosorus guamensis]|uniref:Uncharacterized protein n=1 Tax=Ceraceosorus guamensis TaxID=1522189 RepID=A0A316VZ72_9BASI|nr:hypothetical protein IE81DRAFT_122263 [Ceraceosorus guamensis]PWN42604.1 hypothetical protein IE81DRAFT_122263 [Ceraceosorus guamensis]
MSAQGVRARGRAGKGLESTAVMGSLLSFAAETMVGSPADPFDKLCREDCGVDVHEADVPCRVHTSHKLGGLSSHDQILDGLEASIRRVNSACILWCALTSDRACIAAGTVP